LTNDIWILVACYVINAFVATTLMTIYTIWWLKKRLGYIRFKVKINKEIIRFWFPITKPAPSFVQLALTSL
jgi:hypothetical protein